MVTSQSQKLLRRSITSIGLGLFLVWSLFPIYWILVTALKTNKEIYAWPPTLIPKIFTFEHFNESLFNSPFPIFVRNSFVTSSLVTLISMVVCALAAYALTRLQFGGRLTLARAIVVTYLLPPTLLFIPLFVIVQRLHLVDTVWALVLTYLTFTVPFCTWMLIGYFKSIPVALDEAARIDGANSLQILTRVILPLALPGMSVVALYSFTNAWNEFLFALVFVYSINSKTFTAGLTDMIMGDVFIYGQLMASSVLAIIPILIIYLFLQRYLVEGLAAGGVKQ